jgi:hypothetical protein
MEKVNLTFPRESNFSLCELRGFQHGRQDLIAI